MLHREKHKDMKYAKILKSIQLTSSTLDKFCCSKPLFISTLKVFEISFEVLIRDFIIDNIKNTTNILPDTVDNVDVETMESLE
jgi:hypothetical protein